MLARKKAEVEEIDTKGKKNGQGTEGNEPDPSPAGKHNTVTCPCHAFKSDIR